jgi:hypothetical protein
MLEPLQKRKYLINIILSIIAIGIIVFYAICGSSCSYLKGNIFGIDLKYIGIVYMVTLIFLNFFKKDLLLLMLLSTGIGAEVFLIGFQIRNEVFCPFCLAFGVIVILLFLLNLDLKKKWIIAASIAIGFVLVSIFFEGAVIPTYDLKAAMSHEQRAESREQRDKKTIVHRPSQACFYENHWPHVRNIA